MDAPTIAPLFNTWSLRPPIWKYLALTFALSLAVRIILGLLKGAEGVARRSFWSDFRGALSGFSGPESSRDYLFPLLLGWFELLAFPIFIYTSNWVLIGAWITLKVAPQWKFWTDHRPAFNRFLIGTALVLLGSYFLAQSQIAGPS